MGHACPILTSAAIIGKKGLLSSEINLVISNTRAPTKRGCGSEGYRRVFICAHDVGTIAERKSPLPRYRLSY